MTWTVVIPGQPPSVNHSYKPVMIRRRTVAGTPYSRLGIAKHSSVADYQNTVIMLTRTARPSGWQPAGEWIRIRYRFYLRRSIDCDNMQKALNDAIADALGVNDKRFVPCVMEPPSVNSKERNPRVEVEIDDWLSSPATS